MSPLPSILIIDDESGILETLRILLKNEGFDVTTAQGGKAGLEALKTNMPDMVLTDVRMPQVTGIDILTAVREQDPETPVILMTAQASLQTAIQAVNEGAFYYIQKPFSNDDMVAICRRAAEHRMLRAENKQLKQEIRRRERSGQVKPLGKSKPFVDVMRLAEQVAPTERSRVPAKKSSPATSTSCRPAVRVRSCRSTAARCPRVCSSRSSSVT